MEGRKEVSIMLSWTASLRLAHEAGQRPAVRKT